MRASKQQQLSRLLTTRAYYSANLRSRQFLISYLRFIRTKRTSYKLRGALGMIQWLQENQHSSENRAAYKSVCLLSGRARGTSQRLVMARTAVKLLSDCGVLIGLGKGS